MASLKFFAPGFLGSFDLKSAVVSFHRFEKIITKRRVCEEGFCFPMCNHARRKGAFFEMDCGESVVLFDRQDGVKSDRHPIVFVSKESEIGRHLLVGAVDLAVNGFGFMFIEVVKHIDRFAVIFGWRNALLPEQKLVGAIVLRGPVWENGQDLGDWKENAVFAVLASKSFQDHDVNFLKPTGGIWGGLLGTFVEPTLESLAVL